ncbi:CDP-alcohol phosphatidyltransferase family protein [Paraclostridium bifermentans]|uniref:CDP-alcohol phosphatidyltransferase family protein n=1 Tax=Paraclostridium bifermentans TaxID=1490 RepID=UPI0018A023E7|nr:CDP-alcohol phosphatidyltransferase family protein [Paraclostridium bifermentans]
MKIKYVPNLITASRILGAFLLFLTEPFSKLFLIIYIACGISDVFDGYIARKFKTESKTGRALDSIADMVLIGVMLSS